MVVSGHNLTEDYYVGLLIQPNFRELKFPHIVAFK